MSTKKNPKSGSPPSDSNVPNKGASGSRKKRGGKKGRPQRKSKRGNTSKDDAKALDQEAIHRANERFKRNPKPMGLESEIDPPPRNVELEWELNPVPKSVEREVHDIVTRPGEFGFLENDRVDEIAEQLGKRPITLEQALSLRAALNQEKAVFSHGRLQRRAREMLRRYDGGESILSLSKRFDFPPVNLFRAILSARNWSKNRIKEALREPEKKLNKRDLSQFRKAEAQDRVTHVNQSETHHAADLFEKVLCDFFTANNIRFRTQTELLKEQVAAEGRPVRTPDLLMLDHVEINGVPVAWIDAKHFYGANLSFQRKKTQKQVNRYVEEWGHGAIIYRHGFCDGLNLKGAIKLDASPIDLTELIEHNKRFNTERENED
ncbi:MAG: TPD domain-containing protein [Candidatus Thermoplasmatota archaeon]|nr:TPD domain-containing protein [Candidatus Thermoplasmatota archaeon]